MDAEDERQLREFRAECDKVGIPYDAAGLVRHHRGNAAVAADAEAFGRVLEARHERDEALAEIERLRHLPAWEERERAERAEQALRDVEARVLGAIAAVPHRSGTPEWSKGSAVAQAAGFDVGLAYASDAARGAFIALTAAGAPQPAVPEPL